MRNQKTKEFQKVLAKKYKLSLDDIKVITKVQFEFAAHVMQELSDRENSNFPSIRIPNFGLFYCPDYVREKLKIFNTKDKSKDEPNSS